MFIQRILKIGQKRTKSHSNYTICWSIVNLIERTDKNEINNSQRIFEHLYNIMPHLVIKSLIRKIRLFSFTVNLPEKISKIYEKIKLSNYDEQVDVMIEEFLKFADIDM